jgi:hypothetical protein
VLFDQHFWATYVPPSDADKGAEEVIDATEMDEDAYKALFS